MKINKENLKSLIKKELLKEGYERSLSDMQLNMKEKWFHEFNKFIDEKNPEIKTEPGFQSEVEKIYMKGYPAFDAAELFLQQAPPTLEPAGPASAKTQNSVTE